MQIEFNFPEPQQEFLIVQSINNLRQKLKECSIRCNVNRQYFKLSQPRINYIYASCFKCSSKFRYRKDGEHYRLISFNNAHKHPSLFTSEIALIKEFVKSLPINIKLKTVKQMVKQRFAVSNRQFYYIKRSLDSQSTNFAKLLLNLDSMQYQSRYSPFPLPHNQIPDLLITSSPSMRQNFKLYGQFVAVDITYNLIKQRINGKGWGVIFFVGLNNHNHIIPFAFGITNNESQDTFSSIFFSFFEIVGGEPETILSDQQASIKSSLKKLKQYGSFSGQHLFDNFHIYKNLKKRIRNEKILNALHQALFAEDIQDFKKALREAQSQVRDQIEGKQVREFGLRCQRYAFCNTPPTFFGRSVNSSFIEKTNDIVKSYIQYQTAAALCFSKILKVMKVLEANSIKYQLCKFHFEIIFEQKQLKLLRLTLQERTFLLFIKYYIKSLSLIPQEDEQNTWIFRDQNRKPYCQVKLRFTQFICDCHIRQKTGLPCCHLLCLLRKFRQPYYDYIHKRWLITAFNKQERLVKSGRPRLSRRNIL